MTYDHALHLTGSGDAAVGACLGQDAFRNANLSDVDYNYKYSVQDLNEYLAHDISSLIKLGLGSDLGAAKTYKCDVCAIEVDRDVAGARNNFFAAYGDAVGIGWDGRSG